jgi:hypothetical protein
MHYFELTRTEARTLAALLLMAAAALLAASPWL